ncbi:MAG: response regulator transcription factor [Aquificaceae bacterium]
MRILLIEDDLLLARSLKNLLEKEGYRVSLALDGKRGLELALTGEFDLILLDLLLPTMNGDQIVRRLREEEVYTPILMLTVISEVPQKVKLLSIGADDYLTKPFHLEELLARVRVLVRRKYGSISDIVQVGDVKVDIGRRKVLVKGQEVKLTQREHVILEYLCLNKGRYVEKEELREKVFGYPSDSNSLEVLISRIKKKLGTKDFIKSVKGLGYIVE